MSDYGRCVICGQSLSQIEEIKGICDNCRVSIINTDGISQDIEDYAS